MVPENTVQQIGFNITNAVQQDQHEQCHANDHEQPVQSWYPGCRSEPAVNMWQAGGLTCRLLTYHSPVQN